MKHTIADRRRLTLFLLLSLVLVASRAFVLPARAATGAPQILAHQGRLLDASGNLLGGASGTDYCFKFSFYGDATPGAPDTKLWPAGAPSPMKVNVKDGVFNVGIGDTAAGGDTLDFNFQTTDTAYLNVEVAAKVGATCLPGDGVESWETLSPRQRITSSGYALNANALGGFAPSQSPVANQVPVLDGSGNLTMNGGANFSNTSTFTLTDGKNVSVTNSGAANVDMVSVTLTPSNSAGTKNGVAIQQANSINADGLDANLYINNLDTDLQIGAAIRVANTGGGGYAKLFDSDSLDITGAGAITGATGYSGTGNITTTGTVTAQYINATTALQTGGIDRIDNAGNLVNINNLTGSGAVTLNATGATNDFTINSPDQIILNGNTVVNGTFTAAGMNLTGDLDMQNYKIINIGNAGTDFTATGGLNLAGSLAANAGITIGAGQDLTFQNGHGSLVMYNSTTNESNELIDLNPSFTGGATDGLTYNVLDIQSFTATNAVGTDTVTGLSIGDITEPGATINSQAIYIGAGWDTAINVNGTPITGPSLALLSGHTSALVDASNAVNTAITGTGTLSSGSITAGFGSIDVGADPISGGAGSFSSITIGGISLSTTGVSNITSGASLVGVYDEFSNSNATTIQGVLKDLDTVLSGVAAGSSKWTDSGAFTFLTQVADDLAVGGTTQAAASLYFNTASGELDLGTDSSKNGSIKLFSSGVGVSDPTISANALGNLIVTANKTTFSGIATVGGSAEFNSDVLLGANTGNSITVNGTILPYSGNNTLLFDGATANANKTAIAIADPTGSRTITVPDASGTFAVSASLPITLSAGGDIGCPTCLVSGGPGSFSTLSSTGATTLGNGSSTVAINSSTWGITSGGVASGLTGLTTTGTVNLSGATISGGSPLVFEGPTVNGVTTTFVITDPTANRTITFPNASITVNAAGDLSGTTLASNVVTSSLTSVGALNAGSITSGFGSIDVGADPISGGAGTFTSLTIGSISLSSTGVSNVTSGGSLVGLYDEFSNSNATTVQGVLKDFDTVIGGLAAGSSKWTDAGSYTYLTSTTDDLVIGSNVLAGAPLSFVVSTGQLKVSGGLTIGSINLADAGTSNVTSGASLMGAYDEFSNSNSSTVQGVLKDLDTVLAGVAAGSSKWTDSGSFTFLTSTTDDLAVGGSTLAAAPMTFTVSSAQLGLGVDSSKNGSIKLYSSGVATSDPTLAANASGDLVLTAGTTSVSGALSAGGTASLNGDVNLGDASTDALTVAATIAGATPFVFEGGTIDANKTTFAIADPLGARTITFPDASGTVAVSAAAPLSLSVAGEVSCPTCLVSGGPGSFSTLASTGSTTLGNGSSGVTINSSTWGITSGGVASGLTGLTTTGTVNLSGATISGGNPLVFEGPTTNSITTTIAIADPTAGRTITVPDASGTFAVSASSPITLSLAGNIACPTCTANGGNANFADFYTTGTTTLGNNANTVAIDSSTWDINGAGVASGFTGFTTTGNVNLSGATITSALPLVFEGATINNVTTTFAITDPTANRTITFPDASITVNAAGDLIGNTLASNVLGSSLTGVGTLTSGAIGAGFGNISTGNTITTSGTMGTAGVTTFTGAGATFSGALAANGGITFSSPTATIGAFTAAGDIDMGNYIIKNIGNAGTDFTGSGGLTLAGTLQANSSVVLGNGDSDTVTVSSNGWNVNGSGDMSGIGSIGMDGQLTISGVANDITTGTNEDLTLAPNGSGNVVVNTDADTSVRITAAGASTTDLLVATNSGFGTTTNGVDAFQASIYTATGVGANNSALHAVIGNTPADASDVMNGIEVTGAAQTTASSTQNLALLTPVNSGNTAGTLYGLNIGAIAVPGAATETAINIGSGWDTALVTNNGNINAGTGTITSGAVNGLTLASALDGFTIAGGTTSRTLTVTGGDITIGNVIKPTSAGTLSLQSNGANAITITGGAASTWDIGNNLLSLQTTNNGPISTGTGLFTTGGALTVTGTLSANGDTNIGDASTDALTVNATIRGGSPLVFEGVTVNAFKTTFAITDPTASRTITFPNASGTVAVSASSPILLSAAGDISCPSCITTPATLQSAYDNGATITTAGSTNIVYTLTSGNFNVTGAGAVNLTPTSASQFTSGGALTFTAGAASTWGTTAGNLSLQAAGTGTTANVQIGSGAGSATPDLLVLDTKNTAGDPTGTNGAMYYNSNSSSFRCYVNGAWQACSSASLSSLTAATTTNSIANGNNSQTWNWDTLDGNSALTLSANSTAASGNLQTLLNVTLAGANANATQTTYGAKFANTHTGTSSTNVGLLASASGATNNYGLLVTAGNVGIGTSTPGRTLDVTGNIGGNTVISSRTDTTDQTVTVSTQGSSYYLKEDGGTTNSSSTTTFNITGLPDTDGTFAFVEMNATKGITTGSQSRTAALQVNGTAVTSVVTASQSGASSVTKNFTLVRMNSSWRVIGASGNGTGASGAGMLVKSKTADQLVTNSTTLVDDNELKFPVGSNETWTSFFSIQATAATAQPDIKFAITAPSGAVCDISFSVLNSPSSGADSNLGCGVSTASIAIGAGQQVIIFITANVTNGATPGFVTFQWAQATANATSTQVSLGSFVNAFIAVGADLAEVYYTKDAGIVPGTVVSIDPTQEAAVKRSSGIGDENAIGVISTQPGYILARKNTPSGYRSTFVALTGRIPVRVSSEKGAIRAGDYLTTSSTPGVAMRATGPGMVIGQALTDFTEVGEGSVMMFVKNMYRPGSSDTVTADGTDLAKLSVSADVDLKQFSLVNVKSVSGLNWSIAEDGKLTVKSVEIAKNGTFAVHGGTNQIVGKATIQSGSLTVRVSNSGANADSTILVTPNAALGQSLAVVDQANGGFTVTLEHVEPRDVSFKYMVISTNWDTAEPAATIIAPVQQAQSTQPTAPAESTVSTKPAESTVSTAPAEEVPQTPAPAETTTSTQPAQSTESVTTTTDPAPSASTSSSSMTESTPVTEPAPVETTASAETAPASEPAPAPEASSETSTTDTATP